MTATFTFDIMWRASWPPWTRPRWTRSPHRMSPWHSPRRSWSSARSCRTPGVDQLGAGRVRVGEAPVRDPLWDPGAAHGPAGRGLAYPLTARARVVGRAAAPSAAPGRSAAVAGSLRGLSGAVAGALRGPGPLRGRSRVAPCGCSVGLLRAAAPQGCSAGLLRGAAPGRRPGALRGRSTVALLGRSWVAPGRAPEGRSGLLRGPAPEGVLRGWAAPWSLRSSSAGPLRGCFRGLLWGAAPRGRWAAPDFGAALGTAALGSLSGRSGAAWGPGAVAPGSLRRLPVSVRAEPTARLLPTASPARAALEAHAALPMGHSVRHAGAVSRRRYAGAMAQRWRIAQPLAHSVQGAGWRHLGRGRHPGVEAPFEECFAAPLADPASDRDGRSQRDCASAWCEARFGAPNVVGTRGGNVACTAANERGPSRTNQGHGLFLGAREESARKDGDPSRRDALLRYVVWRSCLVRRRF